MISNRPDVECEWNTSSNEVLGKTARTTLYTLTVTTHQNVAYASITLDCMEKQLPIIIYHTLNKNKESLSSLIVNNLPIGCRVCIYDLFRRLDLQEFTKLKRLSLTRKYMDECYVKLDDDVLCFPHSLEQLTLFGLGLVSIPAGLSVLTNLEQLSLSNNILTSMSILLESASAQKLTVLDLSKNCLSMLPDNIHLLSQLTVLDVSYNCIKKTIPDNLQLIPGLMELYFEWNRLEVIPTEIILNMSSLVLLDLSYNKIKSISSSLFFHKSLILLNLAGNEDLAFDDHIECPFYNSSLQEVDLSHTNLKQIPEWFENLFQLKMLKCSNNQLAHLGVVSSMLHQLDYLDLRHNSLHDMQDLCSLATTPSSGSRRVSLILSRESLCVDLDNIPSWLNITLETAEQINTTALPMSTHCAQRKNVQRRYSVQRYLSCMSCTHSATE